MNLKISDLVKRCIVSSYLFSDSNEKLEKGQYIECKIKEFHSEKPYFILTDADPSLMDFLPLDFIFNITDNTDFEPWIYSVLKEEFMSEIYKLP